MPLSLRITVQQTGRKRKSFVTPIEPVKDESALSVLRGVLAAEQLLNDLPGSTLRFVMEVEETK